MTNYQQNHIVFFSPTNTSAKVARAISKGIGLKRCVEVDLTTDLDDTPIEIGNSLTILAVPVYAGRVAPLAVQRLRRLQATDAPAILVAVYGNRDYEDALVELRDIAVEQGFKPLAAGAFVGEHSFSRPNMPIAAGRPDATDIEVATDFGLKCWKKLLTQGMDTPFFIKGNVPYRDVSPSAPAAPISTENCAGCGSCIDLCPTHAIRLTDEGKVETDANLCIKCCACVKECPNGARVFDTPYTAMLYQKCSARREPELFF